MRITWALFKIEFIKLIKTPVIIVFGIAAPIFFMILQSSMNTNDVQFMNQQVKLLDISLPMCSLMSVAVLGIGNVGVGLAYTRTIYFLKRLKATPAKKSHYIMANFMVQLLVVLLTIFSLCVTASVKFVQRIWNNLPIYNSYHTYVVIGFTIVFGLLTVKFFKYE